MIYSLETADGSALTYNTGDTTNVNNGSYISATNTNLVRVALNSSEAVKSVYGTTEDTNHFSFDTIKAYDSNGLVSSVEYTSDLTTNQVVLPNGTGFRR